MMRLIFLAILLWSIICIPLIYYFKMSSLQISYSKLSSAYMYSRTSHNQANIDVTTKFITRGNVSLNIYFLRMKKTGSTTLFNIFARYALKHRLRVATPIDWIGKMEASGNLLKFLAPSFVIGKTRKYNMFLDHSFYVPGRPASFLEMPLKHVTMVRQPLSWLDSYLHFRRYLIPDLQLDRSRAAASFIEKLDNASWYKSNEKHINTIRHTFIHYFSLKPEDSNERDTLRKLDNLFLVLVNEYYDESMILMRRRLKWPFHAVLYSSLHVQNYEKRDVDEIVYKQLCRWNSADCVLYDFFNKTFWKKIKEEENILPEIFHFKSVRKHINKFCSEIFASKSINTSVEIEFPQNVWHESFIFTGMDCALSRLRPYSYRLLFYYIQNPGASCGDACPVASRNEEVCKLICYYSNTSKSLEMLLTQRAAFFFH